MLADRVRSCSTNATQFLQRNTNRGTGGDAPAESSSSMMGCCQLGPDTHTLSHTQVQVHNTALGAFPHLHERRSGNAAAMGKVVIISITIQPAPRLVVGLKSLELPDKGLEPIWTSCSASNPLRDFSGDLRRCTTAAGWIGHGRLTSRRSNVPSHATWSCLIYSVHSTGIISCTTIQRRLPNRGFERSVPAYTQVGRPAAGPPFRIAGLMNQVTYAPRQRRLIVRTITQRFLYSHQYRQIRDHESGISSALSSLPAKRTKDGMAR